MNLKIQRAIYLKCMRPVRLLTSCQWKMKRAVLAERASKGAGNQSLPGVTSYFPYPRFTLFSIIKANVHYAIETRKAETAMQWKAPQIPRRDVYGPMKVTVTFNAGAGRRVSGGSVTGGSTGSGDLRSCHSQSLRHSRKGSSYRCWVTLACMSCLILDEVFGN